MFDIIRRTAVLTIVFVSAVGSRTYGQAAPLAVFTGTMNPALLGTAFFSPAGDWNSDGVPDFAALRQFETNDDPPYRYEGPEVIDGATLSTLAYFPLPSSTERGFGSAGDWNADGKHEFFIEEGLTLRVQDITSGQILTTFIRPLNSSGFVAFNFHRYCLAEVTGDLVPDLCAIVYTPSSAPYLAVYSGATGSLWRYESLQPDFHDFIYRLPDRNNDGRDEIGMICYCGVPSLSRRLRIIDGSTSSIVLEGPPFSYQNTWSLVLATSDFTHDLSGDGVFDVALVHKDDFNLRLSAISGATGAELWTAVSVPFQGWLASSSGIDASCIVVDDHDGDGRRDVMVSTEAGGEAPGYSSRPYSRIHSGAAGQTIRTTTDSYNEFMGSAIQSISDRDGDGKSDIIAAKAGEIAIHSSLTGAAIIRRLRRVGSERFGACTYLADWDRDGISDLFVSAPNSAEGGSIRIYSGVDRALHATWYAPEPSLSFGSSILQIPDQDFDGIADYAVSAPDDHSDIAYAAGRLYFLSGADGSVIWQLQGSCDYSHFGSALLLIPDIDADGQTDLAVSAPSELEIPGPYSSGPIGLPELHFVSMGLRGIIRTTYLWGNISGKELRLSGDLDMDGLADVFVLIDYDPYTLWNCVDGTFFVWPPSPCWWSPFFEIISSGTGMSLRNSSIIAMWSDSSTAGFADLDGDGHDEIITFSACGSFSCGPGISCHSTFDGLLRWTLPMYPSTAEHQQIVGLPDFSNDGRPDWALIADSGATTLIVGSPPALHSVRPPTLPRIAKRHQKSWTDQDNDGIPEIVVPSWGPAPSEQVGPGEVRILSGADYSSASSIFGSGAPGSGSLEPKLRVLGHPPAVGEASFAIGLSHAPANAAVVLGISSALDPSPTSLLGASFYLDFTAPSLLLDSVFRVPMPTEVNPTGVLRIPLPIPNSAAWHGLTLHFQAAVVDPNAANGIFSTTPVLSVSIP